MRFGISNMASRTVTIVTATLLAVMIAINGGLFSITTKDAIAQTRGNMSNYMMGQGGMMGMGPGMNGPAMMGP